MRKFTVLSIITLCLVMIMQFTVQATTVTTTQTQQDKDINDYNKTVANFTAVDVATVRTKINNGDLFFLYTGRPTCPWCRKLVPVLNNVAKDQNITIFYVDSQQTQTDPELKAFRDEYGIPFVPSLIYFGENKAYSYIELKTNASGYYDAVTLRQAMSKYINTYKALQANLANEYNKSIQNFTKITASKIRTKISKGESFFLYTGSATDSLSRKFVPVLSEIAKEKKVTIFYLDSQNTEKDAVLKAFRTQYKIQTVPSLIYFTAGNKYNTINTQITSDSFSKQTLLDSMSKFIK